MPLADEKLRAVVTIRVDSNSGNILAREEGKRLQPLMIEPEISPHQALEKVTKLLEDKLKVGKIYRNPRGMYFVEIQSKQGRVVSFVKSDRETVW